MTDDDLIKGQHVVRSHGLCGEVTMNGTSVRGFCALEPGHKGKHGEVPDQDEEEDLWSLVDGLVTRIAELEARIAPLERAVADHSRMAMMLTPKATLPIVASSDTNAVLPRLIGLVHERHSQFIPDYDSEGTY